METAPPPLDLPACGAAVERIIIGAFKVGVVPMLLALAQHRAIDSLAADLPPLARVAAGIRMAAIYPVYLYSNVSGYTDFVIGTARFFRIVLPENFDQPFASPRGRASRRRAAVPLTANRTRHRAGRDHRRHPRSAANTGPGHRLQNVLSVNR